MEIALGVALGALAVALVGLVALRVLRRPGRPPADRAPTAQGPGFGDDDLPGFLEFPPGAVDEPVRPVPGWASLAPPSSPPPAPAPVGGREARVVLTAMAVATLLLLGGVAAVAVLGNDGRRHPDDSRATTPAPPETPAAGTAGALADESLPVGSDGIEARLAFGGVVLERHAVGITAAYPRLRLTSDGERSLAHLELATFHCLTDEPPADPAAAGCTRSVPEYADLDSPDLRLRGDGEGLRLSGDFPTYLRSNGGPPGWSGRVYRIQVTADAGTGAAADGWHPAEGVLELGSERAGTAGGSEVNLLRSGS